MTMAHIATKSISRKAGQSAVACAAYRAGDILDDAKYGKTHDYGKKSGVMSSNIVLPFALKAIGVSVDRETLWNLAEAAESRSDSRVAREWLINLPYELSESVRYELAIDFAQKLVDDMDVIADVCIHRPVMKLPFDPNAKPSSKRLRENEQNPDPRNFHAHILVTTRAPIVGPNKTLAFDSKLKTPFEWSNKKRKAHNLPSSMQEIKRIRELWVDTANKVLAQYNLPLMDARSYQDQGLDQQPTIKMGVEATAMERRGITTEKGDTNRAIKARNQVVTEQANQQRAEYERRARELKSGLAWTTMENARLPILIRDSKQRAGGSERHIIYCTEQSRKTADRIAETTQDIEDAQSGIAWAAKRCENLSTWVNGSNQRSERADKWIAANSKRAADSESIAQGIDQGITERARAAPSPFDDNARRARATKLAEEQERLNTESANYDRETYHYSGAIKGACDRSKLVRHYYATKLFYRNLEDNSLRPGFRDSSEDYPSKFDYRQSEVLENFAQEQHLNKESDEAQYDYMERFLSKFTISFLEENKAIMNLLHDPKAERDQYDAIKTHYDTFLKDLNERRKTVDDQTKYALGNIGDVSRMTAESLSAPNYINALDDYINDEATVDQNRTLAINNRADMINRTCQQFKHSMIALRNLQQADKRQAHSEALQASLDSFMANYGKELSNDQQKAINDGLESYKHQANRSNTRSRILRP